MDYKYIHQLLDRYFAAETTAAEEAILRTFFSQDDVPAEFLPYRDLFAYEASCASETLGSNFDSKMLALVGATGDEAPRHVQSRRFTLSRRLRPLYNAAASVAIVLLLGTAAQHAFRPEPEIRGGTTTPLPTKTRTTIRVKPTKRWTTAYARCAPCCLPPKRATAWHAPRKEHPWLTPKRAEWSVQANNTQRTGGEVSPHAAADVTSAHYAGLYSSR